MDNSRSFPGKCSNLFFNQRVFFEEDASLKAGIPFLLTLGYAVLAAISAYIAASGLDVSIGIAGAAGAGFTVLIAWILLSLVFLISLKVIGRAACTYKNVLCVCGYVSALMMFETLLTLILSLIGAANPVVLLLLSGVFLLWSIPVWYFGFRASAASSDKRVMISVIVPVIIMAIVTIINSLGSVA